MPENYDDAKGTVKEKAGQLTGDKDLENEGKVDQAVGKVKSGLDSIKEKVEGAITRD